MSEPPRIKPLLEFPSGEELLRPTPKWEATGQTYRLRSAFVAWGWVWDPPNSRWLFEGEEDDLCLKVVRKWSGVNVRRLRDG